MIIDTSIYLSLTALHSLVLETSKCTFVSPKSLLVWLTCLGCILIIWTCFGCFGISSLRRCCHNQYSEKDNKSRKCFGHDDLDLIFKLQIKYLTIFPGTQDSFMKRSFFALFDHDGIKLLIRYESISIKIGFVNHLLHLGLIDRQPKFLHDSS